MPESNPARAERPDFTAKLNTLLDFFTEPGTGEKYLRDLERDITEAHLAHVRREKRELLTKLRPTAYPDPQGGVTEWELWARHYVGAIDQLIEEVGSE